MGINKYKFGLVNKKQTSQEMIFHLLVFILFDHYSYYYE